MQTMIDDDDDDDDYHYQQWLEKGWRKWYFWHEDRMEG